MRALSKDERRILELLCELDPDGASYAHSGLPDGIRARRRLVGLDPPSVIDEQWRSLKIALDEYERKLFSKPNRARIEAWIAEKYFDVSPEAAAVSPKARRARAEKWAREIMTSLDMNTRAYVAPHIEEAFRAAKEKLPASFVAMTKVKSAPAPRVRKPPTTSKRKPLGKWTVRGKNMDVRDIDRLAPPAKRQFFVAAKKYAGKSFRTTKAFHVGNEGARRRRGRREALRDLARQETRLRDVDLPRSSSKTNAPNPKCSPTSSSATSRSARA